MLNFVPLIVLASSAAPLLDRAAAELEAFHRQEALELLERARAMSPLAYEEHVRLYEQLGITYVYLDRPTDAAAAFDMLLALNPGHALRYTLSPKVTFPFEQARRASDARPAPELRVTWPLGLRVTDPVPVTLEVVADPKGFLRTAMVYVRRQGEPSFRATTVVLPGQGEFRRVELPPQPATSPQVLDLYAVAVDERGNEVLAMGSETKPYTIALSYETPPAWYQRWWVWAIAGVVVAGATGAGIYAGTHEAPSTVPADVTVGP